MKQILYTPSSPSPFLFNSFQRVIKLMTMMDMEYLSPIKRAILTKIFNSPIP